MDESTKASLLPSEARLLFRQNKYPAPDGLTSGFCEGYVQMNVIALPADLADDFEELCRRNHGPLPFAYRSKPGEVSAPPLAEDSDVRTDLPRYFVYKDGIKATQEPCDLLSYPWERMVTFYYGCSYTFEDALEKAGLEVRNRREGKSASIYPTNIRLSPFGNFDGDMVVSMRPFGQKDLPMVVAMTARLPNIHGAPIHIGDSRRIGIEDLCDAKWGNPTRMDEKDIPVFWGCGYSANMAIAAAKPDVAYSHTDVALFISDLKYTPEPLEDNPQVVPLSRNGDPFFASVVGERVARVFTDLENVILDDPGNRGVANLFLKSDLLKASLALSHANRVAVTTGFPCNTEYEQKEETDGLPGALAICQGLLALGKEVTLISDSRNQDLFESCVANAVSTGALKTPVPVLPFCKAKELCQSTTSRPAFDCLLAIERAGRAVDGTYRNMKGKDLSQYLEPVDEVFMSVRSNPLVTTIGIGDGGNELGMGKVLGKVKEHIPLGETIACVTPADFLIAAGVSNWGGYAIALGLYLVSSCQFHWRYRNHGINAEKPPNLNIEEFLPSAMQTSSLLRHMNDLGVRDGVNQKLEQFVDGLPLDRHLQKLAQLKALVH